MTAPRPTERTIPTMEPTRALRTSSLSYEMAAPAEMSSLVKENIKVYGLLFRFC